MSAFAGSRFQRVGEGDRRKVAFSIDGRPGVALEGDTLLVAILTNAGSLRESEFGGERRAGFCLMGACQDCWVWTASGERLRACTMVALEGLAVLTRAPEERWPGLG